MPAQVKWCPPGQQLIEQHAQRVNVTARVDILPPQVGLLRTHILKRAQNGAKFGHAGFAVRSRVQRFRQPEVDHLRNGFALRAH